MTYSLMKNKNITHYTTADELIAAFNDTDQNNDLTIYSDGKNELFLKACKQNLTEIAIACLRSVNDASSFALIVNSNLIENHTPLYIAVQQGNVKLAEEMLKRGFKFSYAEDQDVAGLMDNNPNVIKDLIMQPLKENETKENRMSMINVLVKYKKPYPKQIDAKSALFNELQGNFFEVMVRDSQQELIVTLFNHSSFFNNNAEFSKLFAPGFGVNKDQNFVFVACKNKLNDVVLAVFDCIGRAAWPKDQRILIRPKTLEESAWKEAIKNYVEIIGFEKLLDDPYLDELAYEYGDTPQSFFGTAKDINGYAQLCDLLKLQGQSALKLYVALCACKSAHAYMPDKAKETSLRSAAKDKILSNYLLCDSVARGGYFGSLTSDYKAMPNTHGLDAIKHEYEKSKALHK